MKQPVAVDALESPLTLSHSLYGSLTSNDVFNCRRRTRRPKKDKKKKVKEVTHERKLVNKRGA
jgi:hypothetical protein